MKRAFSLMFALCLFAGCAGKPGKSGEVAQAIEKKWSDKIGVAGKSDFIEEYGNPEWCRMSDGQEETCRFYRKLKRKYIGDGRDKKEVDMYDEMVADFGVDGKLKSFRANAQR